MSNPIKNWFGEDFSQLDPLLQKLHSNGGTLSGRVDVLVGKGISGLIGKRLAVKLGIPFDRKINTLQVEIKHSSSELLWNRTFNEDNEMRSIFVPHGVYPTGYWTESSGEFSLVLKVEIIDGGWHWVQESIRLKNLPLPLWLFPKTTAYKAIVDGKYVFSVSFSLPILGHLLSYSGQLQPS